MGGLLVGGQPEALDASPRQLELQPPHVLLRIERCAVVLLEEGEIPVEMGLLRLARLVVEPCEDMPLAKDVAGAGVAREIGMPVYLSRSHEEPVLAFG